MARTAKRPPPQYPEGYYRGPAWYARELQMPPEWKTRRVFVRFEGVALVANVLVNGVSVGEHRGGFAAFCCELTPYLHFDGKDTIRVRADNATAFDVPPLSGGFTVFGGIYRPVQLIATEEVCVSPLEFGSPGLFLTVAKLDSTKAVVAAKALISNGAKRGRSVQIQFELKDAGGVAVAEQTRTVELAPAATVAITGTLDVPTPHLWRGRRDPYLYTATVRLLCDGRGGDEVSQPVGLRTITLSPDRGFLLNGEPYALHGVNRHQDRAGKGWALSDHDHDEDFSMIAEVGATTVRLAHYQQADHVLGLCDRLGLVAWQEVPLINAVGGTPQFLANARQQLTELILQSYNHPAFAFMSLSNELDAPWGGTRTAPAVPIVSDLQQLAKQLDPARITVLASYPQDAGPRHKIPDGTAWNIYPGWYSALPGDATAWIEKYSSQMGRSIGVSEYGAGANPLQFAEGEPKLPRPDGPFHPQEWQNLVHESLWRQLQDNPRVWGAWIWAMFDFASDGRNEGGTPGINDKGLVTRDRAIRKDTFYFYKANWSSEPMVFIASRRATPRKQPTTSVSVYSNCTEVELKVNGRSLGRRRPDDVRVCRWPIVALEPGVNRIEAVASSGGGVLSDRCEWMLEQPAGRTPAGENPPRRSEGQMGPVSR